MTTLIKSQRIESIDLLRGIVMVIMALDHVRDYFHYGSFFIDPTNLETTTPILFFTRFITHYCAPVFVFLTGTSAFLWGSKKTKPELFKFLFTRGVWLIFLEFTLNHFVWTFELGFTFVVMQVIWAIGVSMVALLLLIYLPKNILLITGLVLVAGHNLLDGIVVQGTEIKSLIWYILHQRIRLPVGDDSIFVFAYPVIPWIGVISLGYCFGTLYRKDADATLRKRWLLRLGLGGIALFFIVRGINIYGDLKPWEFQKNTIFTLLSFLNVTKYPPSLSYLLVTLSPAFLILYFTEHLKNKITDFFVVFGRVPLFYYFAHVFVIHLLAIVVCMILGTDWHNLILTGTVFKGKLLIDYGYSLWVVYAVWIGVVLMLYPSCKKYMIYKANNTHKWWLSYL